MTRHYVCLHGHYYQPPRENPWSGEIDPQPSAAPFHDWNARIDAECYAPNAAARILAPSGRLQRVVNNYGWTSFNFGPTLIEWLARRSPWTYAQILAADQESRERFSGHGSALAQVYNHAILPLCNARDQKTQVRWGIADFEHRFGRRPEGMWLPEAAVDSASLEALAAEGIRFTVLSPRSAPADTDGTRAHRVELPSGKRIAVFFYDGPIAQGVAFEQLLNSGARFAERLISAAGAAKADNALVHIATDGETYGHHHRFGDMALAYALDALLRAPDVELTNYGEYLERFPPDSALKIVENTSWSCEHGLERWRSACGCNAGRHPSATQAWRGPLRASLDELRDTLAGHFRTTLAPLVKDPWQARDAFIDVLLGRVSRPEFLSAWQTKKLSSDEHALVFRHLEAQRFAMFMYTSCGWFFDDVDDLETRQILAYAGRALDLAEALPETRTRFLAALGQARSALPGHLSARDVFLRVEAEQSFSARLDAWALSPTSEPVMLQVLDALDLTTPSIADLRRAQALFERARHLGAVLPALGRRLDFD